VPPAGPAQFDERQAYQFVFEQLRLGKKDPEIVNGLVAKGVPVDQAQVIAQTARARRVESFKLRGKRRIKNGSIVLLLGVVLTVGTYLASADLGGFYFVSFGPILYGLYSLAMGISDSMKR